MPLELIFDARSLRLYPLAQPGFRGATETYVETIAHGLAERGHTVHVIANDLERFQRRGATEFWWGPSNFPTDADALVEVHNLDGIEPFKADLLILMSNGVDPWLGPDNAFASGVDAYPVFSQTHATLLQKLRPGVDGGKCFVTGLGIALEDYPTGGTKIAGRILYANAPQNGLWHVLDIFDALQKDVPEATLHIAYDFDRAFEGYRWQGSALAEALWDCKRRIETTPGIVNLGALSRAELVREQLACQVHVMPQDSENLSTTIHGLTAMECAAAGAALVLRDCPGYAEVFGDAATLLPLPGTYFPQLERRYDATDWAEAVARLMRDGAAWSEASRAARTLAEQHTWGTCLDRWEAMLTTLSESRPVASGEAVAA